jgi:hypothetical protein
MIYSTEIEKFPTSEQFLECYSHQDQNGFEWKIARVQNGFFIAYFGDPYFKDKYFDLKVKGKSILLQNSGCFFIQDETFQTFYEFRTILKNEWTHDIWSSISGFLTVRLTHDKGLMKCETVKNR